MSHSSTITSAGQSIRWAFAIGFIALLSAPLLLMPLGNDKEISSREQRRLAPMPVLPTDKASLKAYPGQFTAYFDDHFGQRNRIISWSNQLKEKLFRKFNSSKVYIGEDDWLFYNIDGSILDRIGQFSPDIDSLREWKHELDLKTRWFEDLGVQYILAVPPNKATIYDDKLPERIRQAAGVTRLSAFSTFLDELNEPLHSFLDLTELFQHARKTEPVYFKTDTHWNDMGAFLGYQEIMRKIPDHHENVRILTIDDLHRVENRKLGDIARLSLNITDYSEIAESLVIKHPCKDLKSTKVDEFALTDAYKSAKKRLPTKIICPAGKLKAIVAHDSFGNFIQPFFNQSFAEVIYMPSYNIFGMQSFIESFKPDIFIDLRVERRFNLLLEPYPVTVSTPNS